MFVSTSLSIITPVITSTITTVGSILSKLHYFGKSNDSIERCIREHDIKYTLQIIQMLCNEIIHYDNTIIVYTVKHMILSIKELHEILKNIENKIQIHTAGYISRWTYLDLSTNISDINTHMNIVSKRFNIMCKCIKTVR